MFKLLLIVLSTAIVFGLASMQSSWSVPGMLTIKDIEITDDFLEFQYEIKNNSPHDIWICDDIDSKSNMRVAVKVEEDALLIRLRSFVVPEDVFLEEPIWSTYVRLEANKVHKGNVTLALPIIPISPIDQEHIDNIDQKDVIEITNARFELGFYQIDLSKLGEDALRDDSTDTIVYVSCFWAAQNRELSLEVDLENVVLPCVEE